jgi:Flp pilus assembly protein TadG
MFMRSPIRSRLTAGAVIGRFRDDRRASAAVEFAFIAPLFFCLLFAIIEVAMIFFAGQTLETATQDSARMIMTGQAQTGNYTQAMFKNDLCGRIVALFDCQNGIYIDVRHSSSGFSSISLPNPVDANNKFTPANLIYDPGSSNDIVVVSVFYQWPLFVTGLGFNVSNLAGNLFLLTATAAFRNEPYGS